MELESLLAKRLIVQAGKGGVGRSTLSAALALVAARRGKRVLLLEVDAPDRFGALFGLEQPVGYRVQRLAAGVWGLNLDPDDVIVDFFATHVRIAAIYRQILRSRLWQTFYQAGPGLRELICLGKIWRLTQERSGQAPQWDCIVVDAPATGHGLALFEIADVAYDTLLGPMKTHARKIRDLLRDPERTVINICALPEEMPVSEAGDLYERLRGELRLPLGLCFANAVLAPLRPAGLCDRLPQRVGADPAVRASLDAVLGPYGFDTERLLEAVRWRCGRARLQSELLLELQRRVPLPTIEIPFVPELDSDRAGLERIADALEHGARLAGSDRAAAAGTAS